MEVAAGAQAGALQHRGDLLAGGARVGGALQHDEVAGAQAAGERLAGAEHGRQVRLPVLGERRRQADQDRVDRPQLVPRGGRADAAVGHQGREPLRGHVLDVGVAGVDPVDLRLDRVEAEDGHTRLGEGHGEGQPDVAEPHHADLRRVGAHAPMGAPSAGPGVWERDRRTTLEIGDTDGKDASVRPETLLAGLPRLVRVADEARWRGQFCVATAAVVAVFWVLSWLVDEPVRAGITALAAAAVAVPTFAVGAIGMSRRVRERLERALPPPRASVHETQASSRERRMKLSGAVLTGIVLLLLFERFTDGAGVIAGLVVGLLAAAGTVDWTESRRWETAERERETRLYVMIRPDALSPRLGAAQIYETPRPGDRRDRALEPSPFDLGI